MTRLPAIAILCCAALVATPARAQDDARGDAKVGRDLSVKHCARCHVVGDANIYGGINSTPSFQLLARRDDWRARFQTFFERRPHPVFVRVPGVSRWTDLPSVVEPFNVTFEQIEDIVSFIETLAPK